MAGYVSIRDKNNDPYCNRFTGVKLPVIANFAEHIRVFDDMQILFLKTSTGEYVCITNLRDATEYSIHDGPEKVERTYLAEGYGSLRFMHVKDIPNRDIFPRPPVIYRRAIKWYNSGYSAKFDHPELSPLRLKLAPKEITVCDMETFIQKLLVMTDALGRCDMTRPDFVCSVKQEITNLREIVTP